MQTMYLLSGERGGLGSLMRQITRVGFYDTEEYGRFSLAEVSQQVRKYRYFKKNGFFKPVPLPEYKGRLHPGKVAQNLSKTKQVILEVTENCNLSCSYCTFSKFYINQTRSTTPLSDGSAERMIKYVLQHKTKDTDNEFAVSFYGGEPLKNIGLIRKVVALVRKDGSHLKKLKFSMTTNGTLIRKYISFLVENQFDIAISLDGDRKSNVFRIFKENKRPVYDTVIENIRYVRSHHPEYFSKHVTFLAVLHSKNSYEEVFQYFNNEFGKTPIMADVSTTNLKADHIREFTETFLKERKLGIRDHSKALEMFTLHPEIKGVADAVERYSGYVIKNYFQLMTGKNRKPRVSFSIPTATCSPFDIRLFLTVDGKILPCEHISRSFSLGEMSGADITLDDLSVANRFNGYLDRIRALCNRCYISDNCKECMFNTRLNADSSGCDFFIGKSAFPDFLASKISLIERDYSLYLKIIREGFHDG